jgi:hypothetical protein
VDFGLMKPRFRTNGWIISFNGTNQSRNDKFFLDIEKEAA